MNDIMPPDRTDVRAPIDAVAWTPTLGFIFDPTQRDTLLDRGAVVLDVNAAGDVNDVEGPAPLAAVVRLDREVDDLYQRLRDLAEHAADSLATR